MMKKQPTAPSKIMDIKAIPVKSDRSFLSWRSIRQFFVSKTKTSLAIVAVIVVTVLLGIFLLIHNNNSDSSTKGVPAGQKQIDNTVADVGKLILLPSGEQPTLAIINDASKYSNIAFFKNAANGDRLLVYAQAREAILYRPSIHKIIAVAPLNPSASPQSTTSNQ